MGANRLRRHEQHRSGKLCVQSSVAHRFEALSENGIMSEGVMSVLLYE